MALLTYSDLQGAIASWLMGRTDLTVNIPDFITVFEAVANRRLRVRRMETSSNLTTSGGTVALPSDYLGFRSVTYNANTTDELAYVTPTEMRARFPSTNTGTPSVFTIEGSNFLVRPVDDTTTVTLHYYQSIPSLASGGGGGTNWLFTAHPDVYLFGSLAEANAFIILPDGAALWKARRDEVFDEITALDEATKGGGSIRTIGWTP